MDVRDKALSKWITIGIPTRNRKDVLDNTLKALHKLGLSFLPIIIVDDCSTGPVFSQEIADYFPYLKCVRNDSQKWVIYSLNLIAQLATTPYIINLDDDSYFKEKPDLYSAIEHMESRPNVIALCLGYPDIEGHRIFPIRGFVAHRSMVNRESFLKLGGYSSIFTFYGEEKDFCMRAWGHGYETHYFPKIIIDHLGVAGMDRNRHYRLFKYDLLCEFLNCPFIAVPFVITYKFFCVFIASPIYWIARFRGLLAGIGISFRYLNQRTPLTMRQFLAYLSKTKHA